MTVGLCIWCLTLHHINRSGDCSFANFAFQSIYSQYMRENKEYTVTRKRQRRGASVLSANNAIKKYGHQRNAEQRRKCKITARIFWDITMGSKQYMKVCTMTIYGWPITIRLREVALKWVARLEAFEDLRWLVMVQRIVRPHWNRKSRCPLWNSFQPQPMKWGEEHSEAPWKMTIFCVIAPWHSNAMMNINRFNINWL